MKTLVDGCARAIATYMKLVHTCKYVCSSITYICAPAATPFMGSALHGRSTTTFSFSEGPLHLRFAAYALHHGIHVRSILYQTDFGV